MELVTGICYRYKTIAIFYTNDTLIIGLYYFSFINYTGMACPLILQQRSCVALIIIRGRAVRSYSAPEPWHKPSAG